MFMFPSASKPSVSSVDGVGSLPQSSVGAVSASQECHTTTPSSTCSAAGDNLADPCSTHPIDSSADGTVETAVETVPPRGGEEAKADYEATPNSGVETSSAPAVTSPESTSARARDEESIRFFPWTAENNLVMMATDEYIAMGGGGGSFGLFLEEDLSRGTTGPCETFANCPLCSQEQFEVSCLELWGFSAV